MLATSDMSEIGEKVNILLYDRYEEFCRFGHKICGDLWHEYLENLGAEIVDCDEPEISRGFDNPMITTSSTYRSLFNGKDTFVVEYLDGIVRGISILSPHTCPYYSIIFVPLEIAFKISVIGLP